MSRVVIVGAGISGLSLAYRLQQAVPSAEVLVLEERDRPGGAVWTERRDGFQVEIGPNGFLDSKPSTLRLCEDIGLGDRLIEAAEAASRNRYLFWRGRLRPLPRSLPALLSSALLSWRGKLDFLTELFRPRGGNGDESVAAFARRRAGREAAEILADAAVTGVYAGDPALLSVRAAFPRLAALEDEYGSVLRGLAVTARRRRAKATTADAPGPSGKMWSFREGLRVLIETLAGRLRAAPLLGVAVQRVEPKGSLTAAAGRLRPAPAKGLGWLVHAEGHDSWEANAVVLTCPAYRQAAIVAERDQELAERIAGIAYNRLAVVALGYGEGNVRWRLPLAGLGHRRGHVPGRFDGFGYIAPQRHRRDVLGVQWCSAIFPERAPAGAVLVRAMCGGWHRPEVAGWDDARLLEAVRADLRLAMGIEGVPCFHHIVRWERAIPQYHLGHIERLAWIDERTRRYPGLFLAGNAYHGVALNDCTEQADVVAGRVSRYLAAS